MRHIPPVISVFLFAVAVVEGGGIWLLMEDVTSLKSGCAFVCADDLLKPRGRGKADLR